MKHVFMVGPTRTGSTALFRALSKSAELSQTKIKELNYFFNDQWESGSYDSNVHLGTSNVSFEASPNYYMYSKYIAPRIKKFDENSKIIIVLRNPLVRLESVVNLILMKRSPDRFNGFDHVLESQNFDGPRLGDCPDYYVSVESDYLMHIRPWVEAFGSSQVAVFYYENIKNEDFLKQVCDFIGISDKGVSLTEENKTRIVKNVSLHKAAQYINGRLEPFFNAYPFFRNLIRNFYYQFNEKEKSSSYMFSEDQKRHWEAVYGSKVKELKEYLEVNNISMGDIPSWLDGKF